MTEAASRRRVIYRGSKFNLALEPYQRADGFAAERELVIHPGAVALVPLVDSEHVCLVENERYAAGKTLLEVPAGTIDPGEAPEVTAGRELVEETGYRAGKITAHPRVVCFTWILDGEDVSLRLRRTGGRAAGP